MRPSAFQRSPMSRRRLLKASAAGALALPFLAKRSGAAGALKPVSMTLDWIYEGPNLGFLVAHDQGYYRDAGPLMSIVAGKGSANTAQLIANKAAQVGFSDGYAVSIGISKGMNIKTIGSVYRGNPSAIMVKAASSIKSPKDLEGKTVAMVASSGQFQQWPAFVKGGSLDVSKINLVNLAPPVLGRR